MSPLKNPNSLNGAQLAEGPMTECQSIIVRWAESHHRFSFSPDMQGPYADQFAMKRGLFSQDEHMNPFSKWMLCGVNGSCSDLTPLVALQGAEYGVHVINCQSQHSQIGFGEERKGGLFNISHVCLHINKTIVNTTTYEASPVCVHPPFLIILSNGSFLNCTNSTCWMSQCWDSERFTRALIARVPRWTPVPVEAPSTLTLFRPRRDFGITAADIAAISIAAVSATAAGIAMSTTVQTAATLNELSASVAQALDTQTSLNA